MRLVRSVETAYFLVGRRPQASEAMLLVGSGRSGTTWITQILSQIPGTTQIFEPLNPRWVFDTHGFEGVTVKGPYPNVRPVYLRAEGHYPAWHNGINRMLEGRIRCHWTDRYRRNLFPKRYLIKSVRANMMLGYIYDHFKPNIIFIMRHPCAVVSSRLALQWHADVESLLMQEALVEDYLRPWLSEIEQVKNPLEAHAIWWAVENAVALNNLASRPHYAVTFEALCLRPYKEAHNIITWLNAEPPTSLTAGVEKPSSQSRADMEYASTLERLSSWKTALSDEDQRRILRWTHRLGVESYTMDILPDGCDADEPLSIHQETSG